MTATAAHKDIAVARRNGRAGRGRMRDDVHPSALSAGLTVFVLYAFGIVPLQIDVAARLGLSAAETSSWIFIIWAAGSVSSIALCLIHRLPICVTWTVPGLVYLGTLAGRFDLGALAGASLMAGVAVVLLGLCGLGRRIMRWLPLPVVMGMFAGSILTYVTRLVGAAVDDLWIAGAPVAGYLLGRWLDRPILPPMAAAVLFGAAAALLSAGAAPGALRWTAPAIAVPAMVFSVEAFIAVSLPLVVLTVGLGNVQGLGFLKAQGYRVPITRLTVAVGAVSIVNACFGGHPATIARVGTAIIAGPDAGPVEKRYWAGLTVSVLGLSIAVAAGAVTALVTALPAALVVSLAGLAILAALQEALATAFDGRLRFGALTAFAVAATPFTLLGITSAFWAILAGLAGSLLAERRELVTFWRGGATESQVSEKMTIPSFRAAQRIDPESMNS